MTLNDWTGHALQAQCGFIRRTFGRSEGIRKVLRIEFLQFRFWLSYKSGKLWGGNIFNMRKSGYAFLSAIKLTSLVGLFSPMALLSACDGSKNSQAQNAQVKVEQKAAERMAGARCVGDKALSEGKLAIARMLAVDIVSQRGKLPDWLPTSFVAARGLNGSEVWNALAPECPHAPTFGTPFGFPTEEIEAELKKDPEFASVSAEQWRQIKQFEATAAHTAR